MAVFLTLFCMIKENLAPADSRSADDMSENGTEVVYSAELCVYWPGYLWILLQLQGFQFQIGSVGKESAELHPSTLCELLQFENGNYMLSKGSP